MIEEKYCGRCKKTKSVQLFSPSQVKRKDGNCMKCISEGNKKRAVGNPVPAYQEFGFTFGRKS